MTVRLIALLIISFSIIFPATVSADIRDLIDQDTLKHIAEETSGEAAKRNLDTITLQHRMRASSQFDSATDHILERLRSYGLDEVGTLEYDADGETMYGTQKSRLVWNVRFAQLWEVEDRDGNWERVTRFGDWDSVPLSLAQDSFSVDVTAPLVDIGAGTSDADYADKDIAGKLVLTSSQPEAVVDRAVGELGAVGVISYAPNQKSAWWKQDDRLVRWGHLGSFPKTESFGFMISLGNARKLQQRLAAGETITFHAKVDASHEKGKFRFATAAISGTDKAKEEIHFTCHLDHPRPGANDNASGCVSILEAARTLNALIDEGILPRPSRTLRFLWPAEIEGSLMYLTRHEDVSRIKANIHMDMVGGGPVTKSIFRVSGGPHSVPSFVGDLGHELAGFVNDQTLRYAGGQDVMFPLTSPEGGKEPLLAQMEYLSMGSDHDVFFEGSWRIPGLYLHDWPDRYIHTNYDMAANIDPTKLKRAAFLGAATGWYLASMSDSDVPALLELLQRNARKRAADLFERRSKPSAADAATIASVHFQWEREKIASIEPFAAIDDAQLRAAELFLQELSAGFASIVPSSREQRNNTIYERNPEVQGPMVAFSYSFLEDKLGKEEVAALKLQGHKTEYANAGMFAYEILNFVDGQRTVSDIAEWLLTELGTIPEAYLLEYLDALESADVIREKK